MAQLTTFNGQIPAEFTDRLSGQLLLQPDVEFIFAKWAYSAAVAAQMKGEDGFDLAVMQLREGRLSQGAAGASNMAEAMSQGMGGPLLLSMGMVFPDLIQMVREAKQPGEVIKLNRPRFIDGATTEASRKLGSTTNVFGTNSQPVAMDQVDVTILEYAGPGDSNGNVNPISLSRFTQDRAAHDLLVNLGYQLRRDRYKFVDDLIMNRLIAAAGVLSSQTTRPGGATSNSAFTAQGNEPFTFDLIVSAAEQLKSRNVPGVGGAGRYIAVLDLHQIAQLKLDAQYQRLSVFEPQYNPLFPGYVRTVENILVCESNRTPRLSSIGAGSNLTGYQGLILAPGAMGWASAQDAMAIRDRNDDGGRFSRFAWIAYEGWQVMDDRFVQLIVTD